MVSSVKFNNQWIETINSDMFLRRFNKLYIAYIYIVQISDRLLLIHYKHRVGIK